MKKHHMLLLTFMLSVLVLGFQNCTPSSTSSNMNTSLASVSSGSVETGAAAVANTVNTKVVGVVTSQSLLLTMQNQTGVKNIMTSAITNMMTGQIGKFSEKGTADSITAPGWIAVTNIAGEVCQQLITEEKASKTPRIFAGITFTAAVTASLKDTVISRMARNFWARSETSDEHAAIRASLDAAFPALTGSAATSKAVTAQTASSMLYLCTAMLASIEALKQ